MPREIIRNDICSRRIAGGVELVYLQLVHDWRDLEHSKQLKDAQQSQGVVDVRKTLNVGCRVIILPLTCRRHVYFRYGKRCNEIDDEPKLEIVDCDELVIEDEPLSQNAVLKLRTISNANISVKQTSTSSKNQNSASSKAVCQQNRQQQVP